jgi:hypothetical protein
MKSIKEKSLEVFPEHCNYFTSSDNERKRIGFVAGANYVLDAIEEFMVNLNLGNNSAEKFYKFDLLADIHAFIEQLKK